MGYAALAVFVVLYLAAITYSLSDRLDSTQHVVILVALWAVGLLALWLLWHGWRELDDRRG
jgi:ABC-type nickel/cobalt efflux system permease component RcnA